MRTESGKRLKGVVFDYSVLLISERNGKVLGELRTALEKLKALGIKLVIFSTHPRPIERELRERGLPLADLFLTKADVLDASGRPVNKGSGLWLQRAAEHLGVGTHQLAYVGDEVYDWVMAGHAAVFYLHARWSRPLPHKVVAYVAETPTDILGFVTHFLLPSPRWEFTLDSSRYKLCVRSLFFALDDLPASSDGRSLSSFKRCSRMKTLFQWARMTRAIFSCSMR